MKKIFCIAFLYVCSAWQKLEAQEIGNSYINLQFREFDVQAEAVLPKSDLEFAYGKTIDSNLASYVLSHIKVKGEDGVSWSIDVENVPSQKAESLNFVHLKMTFRPPVGSSTRRFMLTSTLINHKILGHRTYVIVKSDWDGGVSNYNPEGVGVIYMSSNQLNVFRNKQSIWRGFLGIFKVGLTHIGQGFDHILFVLLLTLPMPFLFTSTRRDRFKEVKKSAQHLLILVSVFTVSHMAALFCACVGWLRLPVKNVEIIIAVTIIVSSINIFWPILVRKEWVIALAFGVFHGLAFSNIISDYGLSAGRLVFSILGLNLGILTMQLLIALSFAPWFIIAAESIYYGLMKYSLAIFSISVAGFWLHEIVTGQPSQIISVLEMLIDRPLWAVAFIALFSLLIRFYPAQSREQYKD